MLAVGQQSKIDIIFVHEELATIVRQQTFVYDRLARNPSQSDSTRVYRENCTDENFWQAFHGLRVSKLVDLWKQFLVSIGADLDPLVQQYVNQKMYEDLIKSLSSVRPSATAATKPSLTPDEENIVRYASGYVPMALIKRFETHVTERSTSFVECLSAMAVDGEGTTFLEYTTQWISKINRGGLFEVNDRAYLLFREIEMNLQCKLSEVLRETTVQQDRKEELISSVVQNDNVLFYWTLLSEDIEGEQESLELLRDIVELWLTIRGFSIASEWMEIHKSRSSKSTKKSKALRRSLKQGSSQD